MVRDVGTGERREEVEGLLVPPGELDTDEDVVFGTKSLHFYLFHWYSGKTYVRGGGKEECGENDG